MTSETIHVSISLGKQTVPVGKLWCHIGKGRERASFEYHKSWLQSPERFALEPALRLTGGTYHTDDGIGL